MQLVASHLQGPAIPMHTSPWVTDNDASTPGILSDSVFSPENTSQMQVSMEYITCNHHRMTHIMLYTTIQILFCKYKNTNTLVGVIAANPGGSSVSLNSSKDM